MSATPTRLRDILTDDAEREQLLPFLPMLYIAWADGELTGAEMGHICAQLEDAPGLEGEAAERVRAWLDPSDPPAAEDLEELLGVMRRASGRLSERSRSSLAELGVELAALDAGTLDAPAEAPATTALRGALDALERALGVVGEEASKEILSERPTAAEVAEGLEERESKARVEVEPSFSVEALTSLLSARRPDVRQRVWDLLSTPAFRPRYGVSVDEYRSWTTERVRELGRAGLGGMSYQEVAGGDEDLEGFVTAFETLGYGDLSVLVKYGVQFGLFGGAISQLGTERHHREYLPRVASMELPGCFAMTELGHGSNVRDLETTATYDTDAREFVVHTPRELAKKEWIGNAARDGRMAAVFAQLVIDGTSFGVHAFLVPIRDEAGEAMPGVTLEDDGHKEGLNGVDNGRISFDQVRVPRESLLDRFAQVASDGSYTSPIQGSSKRFFTMLGTLVGGRVSVACAGLSASKTGLAVALRYGELRRQFGPSGEREIPILDYQTHQRRLLPRLATAYGLHFALDHLVERYLRRTEDDSREVEALAAGLKAYSTWNTVDTLQTARECCGGQGYLSANRFGPLKTHTDVFTTFEGDNVVLLQLVARGLLGEFRKQFTEMRLFSMARYLADLATTAITEKNPVATRRHDEEHLADPNMHESAFSYREERMLARLAQRLKNRIDGGQDSFTAFAECGDHAVAVAKAHVERIVVRELRRAVERTESSGDPNVARVLGRLYELYALWRLEADKGWFLESGYFEAPKTRAIRNRVNRLCAELRPDAVPLVDAFGIPDIVLAAPIAFGFGTGRRFAHDQRDGEEA